MTERPPPEAEIAAGGPAGEDVGGSEGGDAGDFDADAADQQTLAAHRAARKRATDSLPVVAADGAPVRRAARPSVHNHPTQQLPATRGLAPAADGDTRISTVIAATPLEAMHAEEVERTRVFARLAIAIGLGATVAVATAGGDRTAKLLFAGGIAVFLVLVGWMLWRLRDPARHSPAGVMIAGFGGVIAVLGGVVYWGVASPSAAVMLFAIYFFALGESLTASVALYAAGAIGHLAIALAFMTGAAPEVSVLRTTQLPLREQIISQATVQLLYACALYFGRRSRRATVDAVERLDRAVRAAASREALLAEVRQELDRALEVGGPGRYTGQEVGSYRLGTLIGRGGMGEIYEAQSVHDGSEAAVKLLHPATMADGRAIARFIREAELAARLDSPNLVAVLEVGTTAGEIPFLAMERLRGFDLAHHLRRLRKLTLAQTVSLVQQIAAGLATAHTTGVIHRDLKPHNLFLAERDGVFTWKLLDFGVSKLADGGGTLTAGHVIGTPGYMAPEQARSEDVDGRADVYALAAIAYRCLTGHPPFTGKDVPTTLYDVVYKMPTRPSLLVDLPADVDRVLAIGMAKQPGDRFAAAPELAAALAAAALGELDAALRERADAVLARHAWGQRLVSA
ncbi:MAG TPA: serine/threonine-protein kinase [Kofleriaceae bacterium]|nr:serine/threonine-protein kinase [Kofleriaceae bacterium]